MASAFEVYSKNKKKLKLPALNLKPAAGRSASTPLPQSNSIFPSSATIAPPIENLFLSPIVKKKKKKSKREDYFNVSTETSIPEENGDIPKKKTKKKSKPKINGELNDSECIITPMKTLEKVPKQSKKSAFQIESVSPKADEEEDGEVFKEKNFNKKRKRSEDFQPAINKKKKLIPVTSSVEEGKRMLSYLISPISVEDFFENYWEKKPLHIPREERNYYANICSVEDLQMAFRTCQIYFQKNVTITSYDGDVRKTDPTPGRARPNIVQDLLNSGHSIRILNPQTFIPNVGTVVSTLQEYFKCMVGVNSYLTPAGTQGFAPHYDDIEAFVIQMEGEKEWKVYPPRSLEETLPRLSSADFDQNEIGKPMMELTLKSGDLLYFPRGFIHQARSVPEHHSLHLTVSTYQCNSWSDFFKVALPMALEEATAKELELRQGIPLNLLDNLGLSHQDDKTSQRKAILQTASRLFEKVLNHVPWDDAADQLGKEFIHSSFPPAKSELEKDEWDAFVGDNSGNISVRLLTANSSRIMSVEDSLVVYYSTDNSLEPKGEDLFGFEVTPEQAVVFETLQKNYPNLCKVSELGDEEEVVSDLLFLLASRGLLTVQLPKKI